MKTQLAIPSVSAKLKRSSNPYNHKGETVYINLDRMDGTVSVSREFNSYDIFDVLKEDLSPVRKLGSSIQAKPKVLTAEKKVVKNDLNAFYDEMAIDMPFNCANCNKPLYAFTKFGKRACTAHLLPKSLFPSIATNKYNIKFLGCGLLGVCDCHSQYDANLEERKKLKIYDEAVKIFAVHLRHELNDEDLISACKYLGISWEDYQCN